MNEPVKIARAFTGQAINCLAEALVRSDGRQLMAVGRVGRNELIESFLYYADDWRDLEAFLIDEPPETGLTAVVGLASEAFAKESCNLIQSLKPAALEQRGIGFCLVDNCLKQAVVAVKAKIVKPVQALDCAQIAALLGPEGIFADNPDYEERSGQVDMACLIAGAFNREQICLVEAGTGIGKTLAYLTPAALWAINNRQKVVVSTATINLQQQILEKDLPLLNQSFPRKIKIALVKGRQNYLCRRRLEDFLDDRRLFLESDDKLTDLKEWSETTKEGSLAELTAILEPASRSAICSESDSCLGSRCRVWERCFFFRAKKTAAAAQILIVNHHLLFSDLAAKAADNSLEAVAVLPAFSRLIIDEAHQIEKCAASVFSRSLDRPGLFRVFNRLYRNSRRQGLLYRLHSLNGRRLSPDDQNEPDWLAGCKDRLASLEAAARDLLKNESRYRFKNATIAEKRLLEILEEFKSALFDCLTQLRRLVRAAAEIDEENEAVLSARLIEKKLVEYLENCEIFADQRGCGEGVFWLEKQDPDNNSFVRFLFTPLNLAPFTRKAVFDPLATVVCASATLTVAGSFEYWLRTCGLADYNKKEITRKTLASPFNYRKNTLLAIPTGGPQPNQPNFAGYAAKTMENFLILSAGQGLILFTSYAMLREVCELLAPRLEEQGVTVFKQGDEERLALWRSFNQTPRSVLLATGSFWEGVDSAAEALKTLVICRLPFPVPTDPLFSAREEAVRAAAGRPFAEISLPEAIIRFRQGFGRLIRRAADRGVVLVLDNRILNKSYGEFFIQSLPECRISAKEPLALLREAEEFLY